MHEYFVSPGVVDRAEVNKKAHRALNDKRSPEESNIHAHKKGDPCNAECTQLRLPQELPIAVSSPDLMTGINPRGIV